MQINGREDRKNPEIDPRKYAPLIFDKGAKAIQQKKDRLFNKLCGRNWTPMGKKNKINVIFITYTKINSKYIKNLNLKHKAVKPSKKQEKNLWNL